MPYVSSEQVREASDRLSAAGQGIQEEVSFGWLEVYL